MSLRKTDSLPGCFPASSTRTFLSVLTDFWTNSSFFSEFFGNLLASWDLFAIKELLIDIVLIGSDESFTEVPLEVGGIVEFVLPHSTVRFSFPDFPPTVSILFNISHFSMAAFAASSLACSAAAFATLWLSRLAALSNSRRFWFAFIRRAVTTAR